MNNFDNQNCEKVYEFPKVVKIRMFQPFTDEAQPGLMCKKPPLHRAANANV
jgi:hypothetical protein